MSNLLKAAGNYLSLVKFSHTVFAMPFAMIGFVLAVTEKGQSFSLKLLVLIILCMVFARNAAMGFNRLVDKRFDTLNPRTSKRELPSGILRPASVTLFVIINSLLFITTTGFINRLTLYLSPIALLVILGYSYTKRFTSLCHFILGTGLALAPIGAYISVTGRFAFQPLIYSFIVLTWVGAFDIIYALQDDQFDRDNRLHSIPSAAGRKFALMLSVIVHTITFILVVMAGISGGGGWLYWTGALIFTGLLIYQHLIVRPGDLSRVTLAFQTTNGIASIVFALFVIVNLIVNR
jgi:4-hydroxybenzoate polyprenyltransferase